MKALTIMLLFFGFTAFAQEQITDELSSSKLKIEELPEAVIKSAGKDFSIYLPDKNPDLYVQALQGKFIAYQLGKDYEGYENYLVIMEGDKGSLTASYNANGKLTRVVENYKDVRLPNAVIYSVYSQFPDWEFVNDKFLYTQKDGDIIKKQYHIKIKKDDQVRKLVVKPNGEILEGGKLANR